MKKKEKAFLILVFILFIILILFINRCAKPNEPVTKTGFYFDTIIQITIYDAGKEYCLDECMTLAGKYENMLSPTVEDSDIWNINHSGGAPVNVSEETTDLLKTALSYCEMSGGRIDLTMETLSRLWDFHADNLNHSAPERIPDKETVAEALLHVDYHNLLIENDTVRLLDSDSAVSLGFIAKGYIADKIKEYLLSQNVKSAIINLGGNLLAVGTKPDGTPFQFGLQTPFGEQGSTIAVLPISDSSTVSSGVYERYFYQDNVLYHHILDTASGYPVQNHLLGVTILSDSSTTGDALSTTCFVLGLDEGMSLIESLDNVEAVFITDDYALHYSSGF